ncbi:MerR family transcriptional regulator [Parerythrobacter aurantius]|uniref:MerR family transcriptional regulator n=1 Tax=Parerythrobacter aurantius TaxID=3127706 RepID=UPI003255A173
MTAFDDGKEDGALRTIGELGQALGLKAHVLRYWEDQFPMLQPLKRSGGRRYYRPEDVALVETIDRLVNREGYTLKGARQAIAEGKTASGATVQPAPAPSATAPETGPVGTAPAASAAPEIITELNDIRARLAAAVGA